MHSDFVPLHLHTEYSLLDGAIRIDSLIEKAREYHLPALAITDHGNLFGAIDFYRKISKAEMKPIIGCEVYLARKSRFDRNTPRGQQEKPFHLILLCKDMDGYRNLSTLVSKAYIEGFYYKPRIDKDLLSQYSGGLIAMSSCLKGEVPYYLSLGMMDKAREAALSYKHIFGPENFFLEIQANELPEQDEVNRQMVELARELHIGIVATNDSHYLKRGDARAHDILLCIQTGKTLNDTDRMRFAKDTFYLKSPEEMWNAFKDVPEAIKNTKLIAERCNLDFRFDEFRLPHYEVPDNEEPNRYLRRLSEEGLKRKLKKTPPDTYRKRLEHELKTIETMGFSSYFLIVWDFIHYAKRKGIPVGPGRGSAAGSLVAYSLDITELDPLKYGLLFERFLNPERVSMPDIDIDFCMDRRADVIEYVSKKYGKDHVAQIITFGTMKARAAIRDVGRAMNIPYAEVDRVAKLIPFDPKITIKKAIEAEPRLKQVVEERQEIRELVEIAQKLEGLSRHASTHAAGIVISPEPLTDILPLYKAPNEEVITTQYDMGAIKRLGLLKFDFLGLKTLTIIDKAERLINASPSTVTEKRPFSIKEIPLDDRKTFKLLCSARSTGIFQLESSGMRDLLVRMRPDCFEDLIALVALYRPGPLGSGMVDEFIKSKRGEKTAGTLKRLAMPKLDSILSETHGIILYQEQVMEIAHKLANFTLSQADILRKAMGGKDPEEMERLKNTFIEGLKANKISEGKAETLYNLILQFAQYGFNKSHSAAYALIAYRTAYLKTHYPVEFMAASLSADMDNTDKVVSYINECKEMSIEVLPPDINESKREFTVTGKAIRFGLEAVKGVGSSAIDAIITAREIERFSSFSDFCSKVDTRKVNKKVIESLIKAGAFDSFGKRAQLMNALDSFIDSAVKFQRERVSGQKSMFDMHMPASDKLPDIEEWSETRRLMMEKETLGFYITGHPLNKYKEELERLSITPINRLKELNDKENVNIGGIVRSIRQIKTQKEKRMAYLALEDLYGSVEVILFPDIYKDSSKILSMDRPVVINGSIDKADKGLKIIARRMDTIDNAKEVIKVQQARGAGDCGLKNGYRALMLTMQKTTTIDKLLQLKDIFIRYTGDCPVYIKVIAPGEWETLLQTDSHVLPSKEMFSKIEEILGKGTVRLN